MSRVALALLLTAPMLAGCLAAPAQVEPAALGASVPQDLPDVAMEGADVVARTASAVTFRWQGTADVGASSPIGLGYQTVAASAFGVPAGRFLRLNATLTWASDSDLDVQLVDDRGRLRCVARDGPGEESCELLLLQPLREASDWGARVVSWRNLDRATPFEVTLTLEALPMPDVGFDLTKLTEPLLDALPKQVAYVAASLDGAQLYTEAFLPDGAGPWPAILIQSPYNDHGYPALGFGRDLEAAFRDHYVPRGYAVVLADVRGTGNSEGCMDMMGAQEQQDAHDVVEWIAAQPWSDGKVGMWGVSYVGTTPHEAAIKAPPHLVTIVTVAGVTNQWRNTFQNGVPYAGRYYPLLYEYLEGAPPPNDVERGPAWALNSAAAACGQEQAVAHALPGTYEKGVYDAYWAERNLTASAAAVRASVFYSQGFIDRAVNPMEAVHWFNDLQVPKKGFFHQGAHMLPPRRDWQVAQHAWFDHWLKGIDNGILATPRVEVQLNDGTLRRGDAWPAVPTEVLRFHLAPGALVPDAPAEGSESYLSAPGAGGARQVPPLALAGAAVGAPLALDFVSEPLATPLHLTESATLALRASSGASNTYFLFALHDVDAEGVWRELAEGWFNAHLREGFDHSAPLTPGEVYDFRFRFEPREYVLAEGHRLGLRLVGHDARVFPVELPATVNTVLYGAEGSVLEVPVLRDADVRPNPPTVGPLFS